MKYSTFGLAGGPWYAGRDYASREECDNTSFVERVVSCQAAVFDWILRDERSFFCDHTL